MKAVLIGATIGWCLPVPATMTLPGWWDRWAPAPRPRLPARLGIREGRPPPGAAPAQCVTHPVPE